MASEENNALKIKYHCYDCGGVWDINGVDVFTNKDVTKYVCKECRGRCLPEGEVGKPKGVKSVRQRFINYKRFIIAGVLLVLFLLTYGFYNREMTANDYNNYISETDSLRKIIFAKIETFREDSKLLQNKDKASDKKQLKEAIDRLGEAKRYILGKDFEVSQIKKPHTPKVLELYEVETGFWTDPTYENYIKYVGTLIKMDRKYRNSFLGVIKEKVKNRIEGQINKKYKKSTEH
jgi:hypothetical protein